MDDVKTTTSGARKTSRYRGVSWNVTSRKWNARIKHQRKYRHLGVFDDEIGAPKAYDEAARELKGNKARLNFPGEGELPHRTPEENRRLSQEGRVSRYRGVQWKKQCRQWTVSITVDRKVRYVGIYIDEVDAAKAYDAAAREAFGPFAKLNFPTDADRTLGSQFIGRHEARERFGVALKTWERWEREGLIRCGERLPGDRKLYRLAEIERLVEEHGRMCPPYPDPDRPGCYRVPLGGHGIDRREAIIDADCLPLVEGKRWGWTPGSETSLPTVIQSRKDEMTPVHHIIMGVSGPDVQVGHRNGDPLDCRRENLIVRTVQERTWTAGKRRTHNGRPCSSQFKGVSWNSQGNRWVANIHVNGKTRRLGSFHNEINAAEAYDDAARRFFGEHAWLNFPDTRNGERGRTTQSEQSSLRAAA